MLRPIKFILIVLAALVALFLVFAVYVRLAPSDPQDWHVDPATAPDPERPNFARIDRVVALSPDDAAAQIAAQARREGATLLAGDEMFGTWIARTALMRYPDYVSIRLTPEGEGTRVTALSRARFGYSDRGVNAARLGRWIPD
ncbi:DUF1499 domain-containing protein [Pararhodobacter marinus]|uniref:DUF1499 domain-containing protein n=2 Tax=Pararhodobacter marinus TaxID=2184063 RepID=UPI0035149C38